MRVLRVDSGCSARRGERRVAGHTSEPQRSNAARSGAQGSYTISQTALNHGAARWLISAITASVIFFTSSSINAMPIMGGTKKSGVIVAL